MKADKCMGCRYRTVAHFLEPCNTCEDCSKFKEPKYNNSRREKIFGFAGNNSNYMG